MNIKSNIAQLAKYGFFGVIATLVYLFIAWAIIYLFDVSVFVSNTFAFFTAFVFSYIFQTLYVFKSTFHFKKLLNFFFGAVWHVSFFLPPFGTLCCAKQLFAYTHNSCYNATHNISHS